MWFWFWVFAIIVVSLLLCWVRFSEFRNWCKRVFSRVMPDMGGLWKTISAFCGQGWVQLAAIPIVIGLVWGAVELVKDSGRNEVRVEVAEQNTVNVERQARAQVGLERDTRDRIEESVTQEYEILEELGHVEREIMEADGVDAIAAAHAAAVERLRQLAASNHAAAISGAAPAAGG